MYHRVPFMSCISLAVRSTIYKAFFLGLTLIPVVSNADSNIAINEYQQVEIPSTITRSDADLAPKLQSVYVWLVRSKACNGDDINNWENVRGKTSTLCVHDGEPGDVIKIAVVDVGFAYAPAATIDNSTTTLPQDPKMGGIICFTSDKEPRACNNGEYAQGELRVFNLAVDKKGKGEFFYSNVNDGALQKFTRITIQ